MLRFILPPPLTGPPPDESTGVSGIYKRYNFNEGYYERAPYTGDTMRSVFHVREFDYVKLSLVRSGL